MNYLQILRWLPYRILRRFAVANVSRFFMLPVDSMPRVELPSGFSVSECSSEKLRKAAEHCEYQVSRSNVDLLETGGAICFTVFDGEIPAGFAWVAIGNVSGELNHDGKPETGLPIRLSVDVAFIFQVLVFSNYRGRRLYAALMTEMADALRSRGIRRLVLTTEASNCQAMRAVDRMGFKQVGQSWLLKVGPFCKVSYPNIPTECGMQIGRYAGDPNCELEQDC
jgi:ribosomal protein S18 acetylase RimI-like enzyme